MPNFINVHEETATSAVSSTSILHIIAGGTIGNLTEWYNFLLYGYLAPVISHLFFPTKNSLLSLTLTFTVFAVSFLVRPLGGILFGWIGDVYGRQRALIISLFMMGVPTLLIGCLPTYTRIGILSPILLCLFRIMQGISAGGEHTGSAIYVAEHAPPLQRSFWVSSVPTSAALGVLISSTASLLLVNSFSAATLLAWGWRVGYWLGALLSLISIILRINLPETPIFKKVRAEGKNTRYRLTELIKEGEMRRQLLTVFCLASAWGVFYQIIFIWMPTYLTVFIHLDQTTALLINSIYLLIFAFSLLAVGYSADHISRIKILRFVTITMLLLAYPLFILLATGVLWEIACAIGILSLLLCLYVPTAFVTMVEAFAIEERYTGLSFGFNMGLALFGGTCPLIATWLIERTQTTTAPALYMMLAAVLALYATTRIQDKRGESI